MKKITAAMLLILLCMTLTAFSQGQQGQPNQPNNDRGKSIRVLLRFLQLNETQRTTLEGLLEDRKSRVPGLLEDLTALRETWKDTLAFGTAAEIGKLALDIHAVQKNIKFENETFKAGFAKMLSEEQMGRLNLLRRALRLQALVKAARQMGIL